MKTFQNTLGQTETEEELKAKYNPEGSPLRRVQMETLKMLIWLDGICKENKLDYFLSGGNILGIVRHEGHYVPWDDDIDIYMMEKDCKKLEKLLMTEKYQNDNYVLQNHKTDNGYYTFWPVIRYTKSEFVEDVRIHNSRKYRGCQIDIFPLAERRSRIFAHFFVHFETLNKKLFIGRKGCGWLASFMYNLEMYIFIPIFKFLSFLFSWRNKGMLCHAYPNVFFEEEHKKSDIFPLKKAVFEGYEFPVPNNMTAYLKSVYGENYMILSSPHERDHHNVIEYKFFDNDCPI